MGLAKRSWPEIVVHILRNLGGGETSLTELSSDRLEFKLSHIRFDWLKFGWVAVGSLFGSNTVWPELPNESYKVGRKARQKMESKVYGEQNYKDNESFSYKLFDTIICSSTLRLHWKHLISFC
jgi:4-amino-4-deoxy-L-arabinose transferase-like glycosyltransferase